MSQTLVSGRGVTTSKAGADPIIKDTCRDCKRTVLLVTTARGERVAVDPEHIAVVPRGKRDRDRLVAHRVHKELCLRYQHEADKAARRKFWGTPPPKEWRSIDNTKRARAAKRGARTKGM